MPSHFRQRIRLLAFGALLLCVATGCGRYSHVNWFNPGRSEQQIGRALVEHDPYPDQNAGPEVVGGRPLGFTTPPPEPAWAQQRHQIQQLQSQTIVPTQPGYNLPPVYIPPTTNPPAAAPNYQQYQQPTQQLFPQQPLLPPGN